MKKALVIVSLFAWIAGPVVWGLALGVVGAAVAMFLFGGVAGAVILANS